MGIAAHKVSISLSFFEKKNERTDIGMKIKYEFADGSVSEVEVSEDIGRVVLDSRREEENMERNARRN